jgi:hypothetical protein
MISLIQFLTENVNVYNRFAEDFKNQLNTNPPSAQKLMGMMNRKALGGNITPEDKFTYDWLVSKGFMARKGSMVIPTDKGSNLRQSLSKGGAPSDIKKAADGGFKDLRRYFQNVTDEATLQWLGKQDESTLQAIKDAREFTQEDIAIINGLRKRVQNHKERLSFVTTIKDKNPDRLDKLISMGLIDPKTYSLNTDTWDKFTGKINAMDPAMIKALIPQYYQWATHETGNVARNVNSIILAIHPESRTRSKTGEVVYDMLTNLDDNTFQILRRGKKPSQGDMDAKTYELLTKPVAAIIRSFPDAQSKDDLMKRIDDEFNSRVDFKSLDRTGDKTTARRKSVRDIFNNS